MWLQPLSKAEGMSSGFQNPASQSRPAQAPKPQKEESDTIGTGWRSLTMQARPLKTWQKANHHSKSAVISDDNGIRRERRE